MIRTYAGKISQHDNKWHRISSQSSIVIEVPNVVLSRCMPRCSVSLGKQKDALQKMPCCDITYVEISKMKLVHTWTWKSVANHHFFITSSSLAYIFRNTTMHHWKWLKAGSQTSASNAPQQASSESGSIRYHLVTWCESMQKYTCQNMPKCSLHERTCFKHY